MQKTTDWYCWRQGSVLALNGSVCLIGTRTETRWSESAEDPMNYCMRSCRPRPLPSSRRSAEFDPVNSTTSLFHSSISWETIGEAFMATSNLLEQHADSVMRTRRGCE